MADYGVTPEGFKKQPLESILTEINDELKLTFGPGVNLQPQEVLGQVRGLVADRAASIWDRLEEVYESEYPATSEGVNLDNVASITANVRKDPTFSTILGQLLFGTPGTVIVQGSVVSVLGNVLAKFKTLADVTLIAGTNEIQTVTFDATPDSGTFKLSFRSQVTTALAWNASAGTIEAALEALSTVGVGNVTVTGSVGPGLVVTFLNPGPEGLGLRDVEILVVEDNLLLDGVTPVVVAVVETTPGVPQGSVSMQALTEGPTDAPSGTLSVIESPVTGWDTTVNPLDARLGTNVEEDPDFKIRRDAEVAKAGAATPDAVFADVESITSVTAAVVFFNKLDIPDLDGRPPHSVDIVVQGGDEDEVAAGIFETVGGGITYVGDITKTVTDAQGFSQTVKFSRPTEVDIYLEIDLTVDPDVFPVDGAAQVRNLVLAYGTALGIGKDIIVYGSDPSLGCSFDSVPGVLDFAIRVGTAPSPTLDDNVVIEPREISTWDSSRTTVAVV